MKSEILALLQCKVVGKLVYESKEMDLDDTWAGLMLYERRDGKWLRIAECSNFKK